MLLTAWLSSAGWGEANNLLLKEMALLSSTANVGRRAGEGESVAGRLGRPPGSASQGDVEDKEGLGAAGEKCFSQRLRAYLRLWSGAFRMRWKPMRFTGARSVKFVGRR